MGTPYYLAPEVIRGNYDKRCDLWSFGVIAYVLLSGSVPFVGSDEKDLDDKILSCDYDFDDEIWRTVSPAAKDFIEGLIVPNPNRRMSIEEALAHRWITSHQPRLTLVEKSELAEVFQRLKNFRPISRFQMALWRSFLPTLSQDVYIKSHHAFDKIDGDSSGQLDEEEMTLAIEDLKLQVRDLNFTGADIVEAFKKLDLDRTGLITHTQFVVATLEPSALSDDVLLSFFRELDSLQEGFLTKESIKVAFRRKGTEISMEMIEGFLTSVQIEQGAKIDFETFKSHIISQQRSD